MTQTIDRVTEYRVRGLWTSDTLWSYFAGHSERRPEDIAVVDQGGSGAHSYGQLYRDAQAVAGWLVSVGVRPGTCVSVQLPNVYEAVVVALGIQAAGAVINPLLPNYRSKELSYILAKAKSAVIVTPDVYRGFDYRDMVAEVRRNTGLQIEHLVLGEPGANGYSASEVIGSGSTHGVVAEREFASPSEIIFSSGTEATPKAVLHTEANTGFAVRNAASWLGLTSDDVVWMPSPVGHSTGFNYGLRLAMQLGLRLVLQDAWDPAAAADLIDAQRCTYTVAATTFLADLVRLLHREQRRLPTLRLFGCGGAPVPAELVEQAEAVGISVERLYGSTEVLVATWHRPATSLEQRCQSDGTVMDEVEVEIQADPDAEASGSAGGEILIRSPGAAIGYLDDPERTAATFGADGWIRTGDIGALTDDRMLIVLGRKKEIIIRGGINITPREIEDLIAQFPEVLRVAVIGLPDERMGERACACVVLAEGSSLGFEELVGRLKEAGLAKYKLPESLVVLEEFPMTTSGKVQKHELVKAVSASRNAGS